MRGANGAIVTAPFSQHRQARFSRLITRTKCRAGTTSNCSLSSYPITAVSAPHCRQVCSAHGTTSSTRARFSGKRCLPGCGFRSRGGAAVSGARCDSASTSSSVVPGSCSASNSNCRSFSVSLFGPNSLTRNCRSSSISDWIFRFAHANSRSRDTMRAWGSGRLTGKFDFKSDSGSMRVNF